MRALRFSVAVAIAVGLTLLAGDLWLRSIADAPLTAPDIAIHPPRISVVIARPTAKHTTPRQTPHTVARTPVELAAMPLPATAVARATPTTHHMGAASHPAPHHASPTHRVTRHPPARQPAPAAKPTHKPKATPNPKPNPVPVPIPTPPTPTAPPPNPPTIPPGDPVPAPPSGPGPTEPPVTPPPSTPNTPSTPVIAAGVCASYTSQALSGMSIVVSFNVMDANCPVSLASYQSTPTGHTHEAYSTGLFATGAWSLTVPLSCHTSNEVDLFIGGPPLVLGGPNANPDLGAWAIFLPCG